MLSPVSKSERDVVALMTWLRSRYRKICSPTHTHTHAHGTARTAGQHALSVPARPCARSHRLRAPPLAPKRQVPAGPALFRAWRGAMQLRAAAAAAGRSMARAGLGLGAGPHAHLADVEQLRAELPPGGVHALDEGDGVQRQLALERRQQ